MSGQHILCPGFVQSNICAVPAMLNLFKAQ